MTFKFDLQTFGQNLQKLGQSMIQGGILMNTTSMIHRGGLYRTSVWGCGFMPGGCTPPLNIWHPMYGDMSTNPYLTQQGMMTAAAQGKAIFDQAYEHFKKLEQQNPYLNPLQQPIQQTSTESGEQIQSAIVDQNGEYSMTTSAYNELFNKENKTEAEQEQLENDYRTSVKTAGESYTDYLDKEYGNEDGSLTKEEFTDYLTRTLGSNINKFDRQTIENAFNKLNLNSDGTISKDEMSALLAYIDLAADGQKDGKITRQGFLNTLVSFASSNEMTTKLQELHNELYGE